jgi:hypothetical protein
MTTMAQPTGHSYKLRQVQVGKEVTWGTEVAATARLAELEDAEFEANIEIEEYANLGTLSPAGSADVVFADGKIVLTGRWTFEDAPFFLQGMFGVSAPTGAGPYVRTYTNPHNQSYNPISYAFQYGIVGSTALYKALGCLLTDVEITYKKRGVWMYKATFACKSVATLSALTVLTDRALTRPRARDTALYIDDIGGTPGATLVSGFLIDLKLVIKTGIHMKDFAGDLNPTGFGIGEWSSELEMSVELITVTQTELEALLGGTLQQRFLRIKPTRSTQIEQIDYACYMVGNGQKLFENNDGNVGVKFKYKPIYNVGQGWWLRWINTSTVSSLPF